MENTIEEQRRRAEWERALAPYGLKLVHSKTEMFKNVALVFLIFGLIAFAGFYLYLMNEGKLAPITNIEPANVNVNVTDADKTDNLYEITVPTSNNYTINVQVDLDDLKCITVGNSS